MFKVWVTMEAVTAGAWRTTAVQAWRVARELQVPQGMVSFFGYVDAPAQAYPFRIYGYGHRLPTDWEFKALALCYEETALMPALRHGAEEGLRNFEDEGMSFADITQLDPPDKPALWLVSF